MYVCIKKQFVISEYQRHSKQSDIIALSLSIEWLDVYILCPFNCNWFSIDRVMFP